MSYFAEHPRTRWAVPAVAVVLIGATSFVVNRAASADAGLPPRTAEQLLTDVQQANLESLSGTVVQTADLGLPQLPGLSAGGGSDLSLTSLASGSHTWRVWFAGPAQQRLALVGTLGESDVIRNGNDVWLWSSQDKTAVHHTLTGPKIAPSPTPSATMPDLAGSPNAAALRALAMIGTSTTVSTSGSAEVAGRPAYELVLTPKDKATRIAQVRIAIDAAEHIPLRVQVYSTKLSNPAFEVGFTAVDFAKPDARQFAFNPPPGTKVTQSDSLFGSKTKTNPAPSGLPIVPSPKTAPTDRTAAAPKIIGSGWSTVVVATIPELTGPTGSGSASELTGILTSLPKASGAWGSGHVIDGTLFSAVVSDDGRVAIGAVAPDALYAALSTK